MKQKEIKFIDYMLTSQDIPGEKTLTIVVTGCDKKCVNCHFPAQKRDTGWVLDQKIQEIIDNYRHLASCICLVGGDDPDTMNDLKKCFNQLREAGFKTAIFSGYSSPNKDLIPYIDYIKTSRCNLEGGPIKSKTTKQRLYQVLPNGELEDITYKFWRMSAL